MGWGSIGLTEMIQPSAEVHLHTLSTSWTSILFYSTLCNIIARDWWILPQLPPATCSTLTLTNQEHYWIAGISLAFVDMKQRSNKTWWKCILDSLWWDGDAYLRNIILAPPYPLEHIPFFFHACFSWHGYL